MMTPEKKAKELVYKFYDEIKYMERAKICAIIAVDEIVELCEFAAIGNLDDMKAMDRLNYWDKVKEEIEKL